MKPPYWRLKMRFWLKTLPFSIFGIFIGAIPTLFGLSKGLASWNPNLTFSTNFANFITSWAVWSLFEWIFIILLVTAVIRLCHIFFKKPWQQESAN